MRRHSVTVPLEQFAIIAPTERPPSSSLRVLKEGDTFAVFEQGGDIIASEAGEQGLFHEGTRFLSRYELFLYRTRPLLLSSTLSEDNAVFTADLTNTDASNGTGIIAAHGEIHLSRARVLANGSCCERLRISNYARQPIDVPLLFLLDGDFADEFEVRGMRRPRRGQRLATRGLANGLVLGYHGLDGVERRTRIHFSERPERSSESAALFGLRLAPHTTRELEVQVSYERDSRRRIIGFAGALARTRETFTSRGVDACTVHSSNPALNRWVNRSTADLRMMLTETRFGPYPYAGIPWFSAPFGRDGVVTALQLLWADPSLARGVLRFLAATQATAYDDVSDAQPGKIVHELRSGEMAALGEVPFGRYYGSADATPLFVALAAAYYDRTEDHAAIDELWPHVIAALDWMRTDGDPDGDGFLEYVRRSPTGLVHQGWKDSRDSVFHADGTLAEPPISMCEIQGYAYAAWEGASRLARIRGDLKRAEEWHERARRLRADFDAAFWCEELGTYVLALDGRKRQCRVSSSNPGHCLFTGIVPRERAGRVATTLLDARSFSGWGIRTVSRGQARYNPMSYHNGSIWPHDNALAAAGLARYRLTSEATRIFDACLELSTAVDLHRLPELICGFDRNGGERPVLYPVACSPQTWAAGAVYLLLQACLGLHVDAARRRVVLTRGYLPQSIDWLQITTLRVGDATIDLLLERHPHDVGITVLHRNGAIEVVAFK
jgi:glycogen debranching enzyme